MERKWKREHFRKGDGLDKTRENKKKKQYVGVRRMGGEG